MSNVAASGSRTSVGDADAATPSEGGNTSHREATGSATEETESEADGTEAADPSTESAPTTEEPTNRSAGTVDPKGAADPEEAGGTADAGTTDGAAEPEPSAEANGPGFATRAKLFATGQTLIEEEELDDPLDDLELALLSSDVEMSVAGRIIETLREELVGASRAQAKGVGLVVEEALAEALLSVISVGQFDFEARVRAAEKPVTIVFTGVNGVGKTTTIAKLARYFEEQGLSTVLANGDTYRAGANEQIGEHADRLGKRLIAHDQGSDPAAVLYDAVEYAKANGVDVVLGDTAGRLHTSNDLMAQLEKIDRVVDPDMTLFVDEAVAGQDATNRAREFDDAAAIDGAILTKADADSQGGAAISIAHITGKPILFLGTGQGYDDIESFEPDVLVDRLLGEA
ncbi:signal recognition particle-docking protein FtsY [Halobacteriales archaeon QS_4_69_34]|nr:MAG: signal recognition particle-docking protein FtsY [Halobacteriales archaeon QS_4_69_34]